MRISKEVKKLASDLDLTEADAYLMELKAKVYIKCARLIKQSKFTHEEIAKLIGTSRSRVSRISNHGENSISLEILIKLITVLEGTASIKLVA